MFRVGIVSAQDAVNARVRVKFPDRDNMVSWWLPVVFAKTQDDKIYWVPDVGEQVVCLMDEHCENGAVLGAIYSSVDVAPVNSVNKLHASFADGATFEYDRSAHALAISLPAGATMSIAANGAAITIDASGNVTASGATIKLGSGTLKGVARLGDSTTCPAGQGSITSASAVVSAE